MFIVVPLYVSFFLSCCMRWESIGRNIRVPLAINLSLFCLALLVLLQLLNLKAGNFLMQAIGLKVWLFYLPLLYIGNVYLRSLEDLVVLLRFIVLVSLVPLFLGIGEYILSYVFGYKAIMSAIYGSSASAATQNFQTYEVGILLMRFPSTFSYWVQYSAFTFSMVGFAYILAGIDTSRRWRVLARVVFFTAIVASFLSGAKSNILFVPVLILLILALEGKVRLLLASIFLIAPFILFIFYTYGNSSSLGYELMLRLIEKYGREVVIGGFEQAYSLWGQGVGVNTGPARAAIANYDYMRSSIIENYFAKSLAELGVFGFATVVILFGTIINGAARLRKQLKDSAMQRVGSVLLAYFIVVVLTSVKGWWLDVDPINIYFWFFVGVSLSLSRVDESLQSST
jgi:hypothetical protein